MVADHLLPVPGVRGGVEDQLEEGEDLVPVVADHLLPVPGVRGGVEDLLEEGEDLDHLLPVQPVQAGGEGGVVPL